MNTNNNIASNNVTVKPTKGISAVWLVPFIALIFGSWIAYKAFSEKGEMITIQFDSANGIIPNKTEIRYKGLTAGVVTNVKLDKSMTFVNVEVEMIPEVDHMLTSETKFWFVTANVSLAGVSGLDTLLSGSYIAVRPPKDSEGQPQNTFIALKKAPPMDESAPGLHVSLRAPELGSLNVNSPVTYKQLKVGYVTGFEYDNDDGEVDINVFVEPNHAYLVKENTRFWNASGFDITANLNSGINIRTESLESIIAGGIAFDTLSYQEAKPKAKNGHTYTLYDSFKKASMGFEITLTFDWNSGVDKGAAILFQGVQLGEVVEIVDIDQKARTISTKAMVDPRIERFLTDQSQFYIVSPEVSLSGVTNLDSVLHGSYLSIHPSDKGEPTTVFKVLNSKPPSDYSVPGLHLKLTAKSAGSLSKNTGIYYRKQKVGTIQSIDYTSANNVEISVHIIPDFARFVNKDTRFWNASGVRVKGSLQGFEVQAETVSSMMAGGIAFDTFVNIDKQPKNVIANGSKFALLKNKTQAKQQVIFTLELDSLKGINEGTTRVLYQGAEVGSIQTINIASEENHRKIIATVGLLPEYNYVLKQNSVFWLIQPSLSLSGLSDTQALLGGAYLTFRPGDGKTAKHFALASGAPIKDANAQGLQLTLTADSARSLSVGSPISYKSITIGQVDNITLASEDNVSVNISIDSEYSELIDNYTRFYNASGLTFSGNLADLEINTESVDTILKGGISFYNPAHPEQALEAVDGNSFHLYENLIAAESAGLAIEIHFDDASGLLENTKIKYQKQVVGRITKLHFNKGFKGVKAYALLDDKAAQFALTGSKFWLTKAKIGLVDARHVETMLQGNYITLVPGQGEPQTIFKGLLEEPVTTHKDYGLNVVLTTHKLGSVRVGNPVLYRQVKVGEVIGVDLANTANKVMIYLNINDKYAPLVQANSQFWNYSGLRVDAGLFSGVKIDTDSMESIMAGGIAFATPEEKSDQLVTETIYPLHKNVDEDWLSWQPIIELKH